MHPLEKLSFTAHTRRIMLFRLLWIFPIYITLRMWVRPGTFQRALGHLLLPGFAHTGVAAWFTALENVDTFRNGNQTIAVLDRVSVRLPGWMPLWLQERGVDHAVRWFVDVWDIERLNVTGHSIGAHLASTVAARHPDLVGNVNMLNAPVFKPFQFFTKAHISFWKSAVWQVPKLLLGLFVPSIGFRASENLTKNLFGRGANESMFEQFVKRLRSDSPLVFFSLTLGPFGFGKNPLDVARNTGWNGRLRVFSSTKDVIFPKITSGHPAHRDDSETFVFQGPHCWWLTTTNYVHYNLGVLEQALAPVRLPPPPDQRKLTPRRLRAVPSERRSA